MDVWACGCVDVNAVLLVVQRNKIILFFTFNFFCQSTFVRNIVIFDSSCVPLAVTGSFHQNSKANNLRIL